MGLVQVIGFPYFFVGTFIEARETRAGRANIFTFPYFFVGTFIEASSLTDSFFILNNFPTFS